MNHLIACSSAALALAACNGSEAGTGELPVADAPVEAVAAPEGQEWTEIVSKTDAGGYVVGNPDAPVKLVEFASMTCGACAFFSANGEQELKEEYVKSGRVSFEIRNYTRDPVDVTAAILARCGADSTFFPMTGAMFAAQNEWFGAKLPELQQLLPQIQSLSPNEQFARVAETSGLRTFAVQRGLPASQADACLADEDGVSELVSMQNAAVSDFGVNQTPTFLINNVRVEDAGADFATLRPALDRALGEDGDEAAAE